MRHLANQAARNFVERSTERERTELRAALLQRILDENKALRADNDTLAIGIGAMEKRMAEMEAQIEILLDRTRDHAKSADPYYVPVPPKPNAPRKLTAVIPGARERWAS